MAHQETSQSKANNSSIGVNAGSELDEAGGSMHAEMMWAALQSTLNRVLNDLLVRDPHADGKLISREDYLAIYEQIYHLLCLDRNIADAYGHKLYEAYGQLVQKCMDSSFQTQPKSDDKKRLNAGLTLIVGKGEEGIERFLEQLKGFHEKIHVAAHTFGYMERYFIPRKSLPTLKEAADTQFNQQVFKKASQQLKTEFVALAERRREGKPVNDSLFSEVVTLFVEMPKKTTTDDYKNNYHDEMGAYEDLEAFILHKFAIYYSKKAPQWPQDTMEKKAEQALIYERDFAEKFLLESSVVKIEEGVKKALEKAIRVRQQITTFKNGENIENVEENNVKAPPQLNCSTHHKRQDASNLVDAFFTTNV